MAFDPRYRPRPENWGKLHTALKAGDEAKAERILRTIEAETELMIREAEAYKGD